MNIGDIIKALAEKGISITEQEVQSKIGSFSRDFRLSAEEATRAALNHFISISKSSVASAKLKAPVAEATEQVLTPSPALAQVDIASRDTSDNIFALIVKLSNCVPCRLASQTDIIREAASTGITPNEVEYAIKALVEKGKCIEPFIGKLYPLYAAETKSKIPHGSQHRITN